MGAKRYSTEQIIVKLREAEIEMGRGMKVPEAREADAVVGAQPARGSSADPHPAESGRWWRDCSSESVRFSRTRSRWTLRADRTVPVRVEVTLAQASPTVRAFHSHPSGP